jgi:membrane-associated protein
VATGATSNNVYLLAGMLMCAAIIGDNVGYMLGYHAGPRIFSRPKSRFFHPDHLQRTREFYEKHGGRAVVYARFIPIIRTCTPFIAGVARMRYARFLLFSLFGGIFWIAFMTTLGYQLGQIPVVRRNFEKVVIGIVVLSLVPVALEARKKRSSATVA